MRDSTDSYTLKDASGNSRTYSFWEIIRNLYGYGTNSGGTQAIGRNNNQYGLFNRQGFMDMEPFQNTNTPNSAGTDSSLTTADLTGLFKPLAMDDSIIDTNPMCDLPEIDMQRWALVSVVLSGRVVDVYLDGKLARSCVTRSYYKVDPAGVKLTLLDKGGFDGHLSNTNLYNYALTPGDIYSIYQSGPFGTSSAVTSWFSSLGGN